MISPCEPDFVGRVISYAGISGTWHPAWFVWLPGPKVTTVLLTLSFMGVEIPPPKSF